jgi:NAD+ diphosphatase
MRTLPRGPNVFAGPYLDRLAHLRKDAAWLRQAVAGTDALVVPVWQSKSLVRRSETGLVAVFLAGTDELAGASASDEAVLLGRHEDKVYFAREWTDPVAVVERTGGRFEDLRLAGAMLDAQQAGVLAYARALFYWRSRHRFCGACGAPCHAGSAGHVQRCTNELCAAEHFPRLDPAIIVLVTDGERALLGRQASWPEGRYSTIAGFVEPGESLEDAVAREVAEETGIAVEAAEYQSSQPWPFPSSLMIGYRATARPGHVPRADEELEDARWFTREDIAAGFPGLPPPQSISYRLIEDWYDSGSATPLRATPGVRSWSAPRR